MADVEVNELFANMNATLDNMKLGIFEICDEFTRSMSEINDEHNKSVREICDEYNRNMSEINDEHNESVSEINDEHNKSVREICDEYKRNMSEMYEEEKQCINVLRQNLEDERNERKQSYEELQRMMMKVYKSLVETRVEPEVSKPVESGTRTHATAGELSCVGVESESKVHVPDQTIHEYTDMQTVLKGHVGMNENVNCDYSNNENKKNNRSNSSKENNFKNVNCKNVNSRYSIKKYGLNEIKPNEIEWSCKNNLGGHNKHGLYVIYGEQAQRNKSECIKSPYSNNNNHKRESLICRNEPVDSKCDIERLLNKHNNNTSEFKSPELVRIINKLNLSNDNQCKYKETEWEDKTKMINKDDNCRYNNKKCERTNKNGQYNYNNNNQYKTVGYRNDRSEHGTKSLCLNNIDTRIVRNKNLSSQNLIAETQQVVGDTGWNCGITSVKFLRSKRHNNKELINKVRLCEGIVKHNGMRRGYRLCEIGVTVEYL